MIGVESKKLEDDEELKQPTKGGSRKFGVTCEFGDEFILRRGECNNPDLRGQVNDVESSSNQSGKVYEDVYGGSIEEF